MTSFIIIDLSELRNMFRIIVSKTLFVNVINLMSNLPKDLRIYFQAIYPHIIIQEIFIFY
jgi:hypothetical protein